MTDPKLQSDRNEQQERVKWYDRTRYQVLLFAGGIALFGLVLGLLLDWYIDPQTSAQKKDLVQALGLITAGVAGAVGIFFTWRGQRQTREAQEENQRNTQAQLRHAREELSLTRQGQITERFTRAIDQLGHERTEIRLGGIYALERIARESEEDHWPIMEVLTAYVRQHAPWPPAEVQQSEEGTDLNRSEEDSGGSRQKSEPTEVPAPASDIQAIMTVLRRRTHSLGHGESDPLDLHEANLARVNLSTANLRGADLSATILREADLWRADLSKADL
jgi:Pentapeptide repeats (8 copies)